MEPGKVGTSDGAGGVAGPGPPHHVTAQLGAYQVPIAGAAPLTLPSPPSPPGTRELQT